MEHDIKIVPKKIPEAGMGCGLGERCKLTQQRFGRINDFDRLSYLGFRKLGIIC